MEKYTDRSEKSVSDLTNSLAAEVAKAELLSEQCTTLEAQRDATQLKLQEYTERSEKLVSDLSDSLKLEVEKTTEIQDKLALEETKATDLQAKLVSSEEILKQEFQGKLTLEETKTADLRAKLASSETNGAILKQELQGVKDSLEETVAEFEKVGLTAMELFTEIQVSGSRGGMGVACKSDAREFMVVWSCSAHHTI